MNKKEDIEFKSNEKILQDIEENKKKIHKNNLENVNKEDEMNKKDDIEFKSNEEILNNIEENKKNIYQKN